MQKARRHNINAAPTACKRTGSGSISLLCSRFFSPFPHGTGSLSVSGEYLALADGPAKFTQDFSCPALLRILLKIVTLPVRACHPLRERFPTLFQFSYFSYIAVLQPPSCIATSWVWANALSLATTRAITFVFFSYGYLDVSVPHVCLPI